MIHLYSGTPGSGKSFHATEKIFYRLRNRGNVIANYPINLENCASSLFGYWLHRFFKTYKPHLRKLGQFYYVDNTQLTVSYLKEYARKNHKPNKEGQTLVVIDECGIMFNPRTFSQSDRLEWIQFFSMHRHYGYDFILISQSDRMVDRQIRSFFEYEHKHRNVGHFKLFGRLLALFCGGSLFIDVTTFYCLREKVSSDFFRFSKRIASLYDSYALYDVSEKEDTPLPPSPDDGETEAEQGGGPPSGTDGEECLSSILDNSNT